MRYVCFALLALLFVTGCDSRTLMLADEDAGGSLGVRAEELCPVTRPPDPPLTPPRAFTDFLRAGIQPVAYREQAVLLSPEHFWYGNAALWLSLPIDGVLWNTKQPWWRETPGQLQVLGRRLDIGADAPMVPVADVPDGYGGSGFQAAGWSFPEPGCWEVVASVGGGELRFIVRVIPQPTQ